MKILSIEKLKKEICFNIIDLISYFRYITNKKNIIHKEKTIIFEGFILALHKKIVII